MFKFDTYLQKCQLIGFEQFKDMDAYKCFVVCPYCECKNIHFVNKKQRYVERRCDERCKRTYQFPINEIN
jgi:hypothetical protein